MFFCALTYISVTLHNYPLRLLIWWQVDATKTGPYSGIVSSQPAGLKHVLWSTQLLISQILQNVSYHCQYPTFLMIKWTNGSTNLRMRKLYDTKPATVAKPGLISSCREGRNGVLSKGVVRRPCSNQQDDACCGKVASFWQSNEGSHSW